MKVAENIIELKKKVEKFDLHVEQHFGRHPAAYFYAEKSRQRKLNFNFKIDLLPDNPNPSI